MESLKNRVALVTGGSRGIGREIAIALATAGVNVAVNYRGNAQAAEETCKHVRSLGGKVAAVQGDVSVAGDVRRVVAAAQRELGPIDILVNNAGISRRMPLEQLDERVWDELIRVNLTSAFLMTQAVLPGMRAQRWGRIINVSSVAAQTGGVIGPHYAASKAGMLGLTHSYASLLAKEGITANSIAPALIVTDMLDDLPKGSVEKIPVGRLGTADEVADVAVMLARNGYITGQTINVNGGWYMS
ncbi:MAG: 3-oxoacyl-ACP reductase family protein [Tepidisphaeraceae bacterium]